ncbi:MAG: DUF3352 domain-containing protein [Chloroflexota bacterium]|jgi:hypothetical protein
MAKNETTPKSGRRPLLLAGLALLLLAAVAVVILLVDPFGWRLLDKASGLRDEAAAAMPPDAALYAGLDLANFSEERLTEFSRPFVTALAEPGVDDLGSGLDRLDAMLAQEIGLTLGDDVMPWLGRSVGLALTDLALRPDGTVDRLGWLLVAGSQDRPAADAFLADLSEQLSRRRGLAPAESEYRGRRIITFGPDEDAPLSGVAFTRSGGQVILGSDEATLRAAIDAQRGQSLNGSETFRSLTAALPEERGLTLYADQQQLPELGRLLSAAAPLAVGPLDLANLILPPGAVGVSMVDQGLRLDLAAPAGDGQANPGGARELAGRVPAEALAVFGGDSLDGSWQSLKASLAVGGGLGDFEESMALLRREFGYDPDQALLPLLDGEWVAALLPAGEGLVLELTGRPLGVVLLASSQDPDGLAAAVDDLSQGLADQRLPLATVEVGGVSATTVDLASLIGAPLPLYGVDESFLFLGTDAQLLAQTLSGDGRLVDDPAYQAAGALLPDDTTLSAYVDVAGLLARLDGGESEPLARLLTPVQRIVAGGRPAGDGLRQGVSFIVVE